jgi:putative colanic acid biosynthesis acetyltransferase WcaF
MNDRPCQLLWTWTWILLAAWTPPALHPWRRALLRLFGARVAQTAGVYGSARISNPANLVMGEHSYIGRRVLIDSFARVEFGDYALASQGAVIMAWAAGPRDPAAGSPALGVRIGAHAWVATEAYLGPGVDMGEGSVLGARACTFDNLDPWTIYAGNPAQALRRRNHTFISSPLRTRRNVPAL